MSLKSAFIADIEGAVAKELKAGVVAWKSPSNIALVKYWGKRPIQIPVNASLSFTLSEAQTHTSLHYQPKLTANDEIDMCFYFEGKENTQFTERILTYLESIHDLAPFLSWYKLEFRSTNSFPHSAGIASSASAFSAIALCILSLEERIYEQELEDDDFRKKASYLARLGSGSACRSVFPKLGWWGFSEVEAGSNDEFATEVTDWVDPIFQDFQDSILIVSAEEKAVSSSMGHDMMNGHPYAKARIDQAARNIAALKEAMSTGNIPEFGRIVEEEALSLHALMLSSNPGYFLVTANSIQLIDKIRAYRNEKQIPVYFTLDAGPNIHLLYPKEYQEEVRRFIKKELKPFCVQVLFDEMGDGPIQVD